MSSTATLQSEADQFRESLGKIVEQVGKVIVGHRSVVEGTVTAIVSGGNVLLEGVPGLGKTELVKALSKVLDLEFNRIQFTPDLMPADIIGTTVMNSDGAGGYRFEFRRGPIFTQILLADEINRATPKTQSALLETMQEGSVTTGGQTHILTQPFFVLSTQNPIEQEGTYPLPEAQLDRFMFKLNVSTLGREDLNEVVSRTILREPVQVEKVLDGPGILALRRVLDKVVVADAIRDFAVRLVLATHPQGVADIENVNMYVRWGASPRAAQALIRAGRVHALAEGRAHMAFEDVRRYAVEVLQHRILLNYDGQAENLDVVELIEHILEVVQEKAD
jgi:MoxR-like ATPase